MPDSEVRIVDLKLPVTVRKHDRGYTASGRTGRQQYIAHAATADEAVAAWATWVVNGTLQEDG